MKNLLDQLEPTKVIIQKLESESNDKYLEQAVVQPAVYSYAWIFCSNDTDEETLLRLEELNARLQRVLIDDYTLNYLKPDLFHYHELIEELPPIYKLPDLFNERNHSTWILQFNLSQKMTPKSIFRLFTSIGDWINEINNLGTMDSVIYESNRKKYFKLLNADADFYYGCGIIKRGKKQLQPGPVDLINKLVRLVKCSIHLCHNEIDYSEEFFIIYKHYAETRKYPGFVLDTVAVQETLKKMCDGFDNIVSFLKTNNNGPVHQLKVLRNAFDFRSTFNQ